MNMQNNPSEAQESKELKGMAQSIAQKVQFIFEREMDSNKATEEAARVVYDSFSPIEKQTYFIPFLKNLLESVDGEELTAKVLASLYWDEKHQKQYSDFLNQVIKRSIHGHWIKDLPEYHDEKSGRKFSYYAHVLGASFIEMMRLTSENYEALSDWYSLMIRDEMQTEEERKRLKKKGGKSAKQLLVEPIGKKKLYDDVFDYIYERSKFHSETLNQVNPNEFIILLSDRLRSTKRYTVQDVMHRRALEKKKELEKELKAREASAEDIIKSYQPFQRALKLFYEAKLYNSRYMMVEKKRVTYQLLPLLLGTAILGANFMGLLDLSLGSMVFLGFMTILPSLLLTRGLTKAFYPKDITDDLEEEVSLLLPILKKCSQTQLSNLLSRNLKDIENFSVLYQLPEFMLYIYSVMPDRGGAIIQREELEEIIARLRYTLSHRQKQLHSPLAS